MSNPPAPETSPAMSVDRARAYGRSLRDRTPRSRHASLAPVERDPVAILEQQHVTRLQGLVPVRVERMLESPFAYYRGTAAIMAYRPAGHRASGGDLR